MIDRVLILALAGAAVGTIPEQPVTVTPTAETEPVPGPDDATDDVVIWLCEPDPGRSRILGTDKSGLGVYDLEGKQVQFLKSGELNSVTVRSGFPLGARKTPLAAASLRDSSSIILWTIDRRTGRLAEAPGSPLKVSPRDPLGVTLYRSPRSGEFSLFVGDKSGNVEQWRLGADDAGTIRGTLLRTLKLGGQLQGMTADDELSWFYASEANKGIWRLPAEPADDAAPVLVDSGRPQGHLALNAEGLTLYGVGGGEGYLLCSSQGDSTFTVYERRPPNRYIGSFAIGASASVDGCEETVGIDVTSASLGPEFPMGLMVAHDGKNHGHAQNFKLVPWEHIARAFDPQLRMEPRAEGR